MDKEDSLVKIALTPILVTIGWMSLVAMTPVMAQNGPVAQPEAAPDMPTANPNPIDEVLAMDNGLWDGAMIGPGCAICGGGSNRPADWYTIQGVRILSRSNLRKRPISFQSPEDGAFEAELVIGSTSEYQVKNLDISTIDSFVTSTGRIVNPFMVMNTKQLGLGIAPGYDVTIGHYFCRDKNNNDHFVEFQFWGLNSWSTARTIDGYNIPVYDEAVNPAYTEAEATAINNGTLMPTKTDKEVGSLRTSFPTPSELPGITNEQRTLSLAFNNGVSHFLSYRSTMNNFELNGRFNRRGAPDRLVMLPNGRWQRQCQPGTYMSYLYGLRFMQLDETFGFHSLGYGQWGDWTDEVQYANGDYNIVSHNSLLGLQVGADMMFRKCRWAWGIQSKVGPCINFANQISNINASANNPGSPDQVPYSQRLVKNKYTASLIGEVGFQATYKFRPNLMGRAGYNFMWISGLALAPEQLQLIADPVDRITTNGTIFSHGVNLSMEWMW